MQKRKLKHGKMISKSL